MLKPCRFDFILFNSSMTLLFYYLATLQNVTVVTSRCVQFTFGDKGVVTCQIRECPVTDKEGKREGKNRTGSVSDRGIQSGIEMVCYSSPCDLIW